MYKITFFLAFTITHIFSNIVKKNKFKLYLLSTNMPTLQLPYRLK